MSIRPSKSLNQRYSASFTRKTSDRALPPRDTSWIFSRSTFSLCSLDLHGRPPKWLSDKFAQQVHSPESGVEDSAIDFSHFGNDDYPVPLNGDDVGNGGEFLETSKQDGCCEGSVGLRPCCGLERRNHGKDDARCCDWKALRCDEQMDSAQAVRLVHLRSHPGGEEDGRLKTLRARTRNGRLECLERYLLGTTRG